MTVEELSNRIIRGDLFSEEGRYICTQNDYDSANTNIVHYGVLGMKWGVRKDRKRKGETDQQYKDRMDRESRERQAEKDRKARSKDQKRSLKAQERQQKRVLRSQERTEKARQKAELAKTKANLDAQAKQRRDLQKQLEKQEARKRKDAKKAKEKKSSKGEVKPISLMTDDELNAAINRINLEKNYKKAKKNPGAFGKVAATILIPVGTEVVKKTLTRVADKKIREAESKYKAKKAEKIIDKAKKEAAAFNKAAAGVSEDVDFSALASVLGMSYQELTKK